MQYWLQRSHADAILMAGGMHAQMAVLSMPLTVAVARELTVSLSPCIDSAKKIQYVTIANTKITCHLKNNEWKLMANAFMYFIKLIDCCGRIGPLLPTACWQHCTITFQWMHAAKAHTHPFKRTVCEEIIGKTVRKETCKHKWQRGQWTLGIGQSASLIYICMLADVTHGIRRKRKNLKLTVSFFIK